MSYWEWYQVGEMSPGGAYRPRGTKSNDLSGHGPGQPAASPHNYPGMITMPMNSRTILARRGGDGGEPIS